MKTPNCAFPVAVVSFASLCLLVSSACGQNNGGPGADTAPAVQAQASVCDLPSNLCYVPLVEGDTKIVGRYALSDPNVKPAAAPVAALPKSIIVEATLGPGVVVSTTADLTTGEFVFAKLAAPIPRGASVKLQAIVDGAAAVSADVLVLYFCQGDVRHEGAPCIYPLSQGSTTVSGYAPPGTSVTLEYDAVKGATAPRTPKRINKDGSFSVSVAPLSPLSFVWMSFAGIPSGPYPISSSGASTSGGSCSSPTQAACLSTPHAGDKTVTGFVTPGASVEISVNGTSVGTASVNPDGSFARDVAALTAAGSVRADVTNAPVTNSLRAATAVAAPAPPPPPNCISTTKSACFVSPYVGDDVVKIWPAGGTSAKVTVNGNEPVSALLQGDGSLVANLKQCLADHDNVYVSVTSTPPQSPLTASVAPAVPPASGTTSSLYTLGMAGVNVTGAGSSGPSQQFFAEFDVMAPLPWLPPACPRGKSTSYPLSQRCWVWFDPRIASIPSQTSTALSSVSSPASLTGGLNSQSLGQITQTFEFQTGIEYYLDRSPWFGRQFGFNDSWARISGSLIAGGGVVTPFNTVSSAPEYTLNANLAQQFLDTPSLVSQYQDLARGLCNYGLSTGNPTGLTCPSPLPNPKPTTVAFLYPNRSRFYRDFYAGLRLRTFFLTGNCPDPSDYYTTEKPTTSCKVQNTYPGTFDFRFGEDETVTAGKLRPVVMTVVGNYPLPGTAGAVRIFGSAYLHLKGNKNTPALVLVPTTSSTPISDPSVVVQQIATSDQDYFRLGLGVDLIALISKWTTASSKTN